MKRLIGLIGVCSIIFLWSGNAVAVPPIQDCTVTGAGFFVVGGEVFVGEASDIAGVETINWVHTAAGIVFTTMTPDADGIECRLNGTVSADFLGTGTASVNGVPGHSYLIEIEDNRPAPDAVVLVASIAGPPTVRANDTRDFVSPLTVVIPPFLPVTEGDSGRGLAMLRLDAITCFYRGDETTSETYELTFCADPDGPHLMAGDMLDIIHAELRIMTDARSSELTVVEAEIASGGPVAGIPDTYSIVIGDLSGGILYSFAGAVEDGDIAITLLP